MDDFEEIWGFPCNVRQKNGKWEAILPHDFPEDKVPSFMELERVSWKIVVRGTAEQVLDFLATISNDSELPGVAICF